MEKRSELTMKDKLRMQTDGSDLPTVSYMTPKAIVFFISSVMAVVCMFLNWFSLDVNLGYINLKEILGTVNVFTLPGAVAEIKDALGMLGALLPEDITAALSATHFVSIVLMIAAIASSVCYAISVFFRLKANDKCVITGRIGAALAVTAAVGFIALVRFGLGSALNAVGASDVADNVMGMVIGSPCSVTLVAAIISAVCAVLDMGFKEDVVIYHDGKMKIARGPKWKCRCGRMNLSLLERCYYCGKDRQ